VSAGGKGSGMFICTQTDTLPVEDEQRMQGAVVPAAGEEGSHQEQEDHEEEDQEEERNRSWSSVCKCCASH